MGINNIYNQKTPVFFYNHKNFQNEPMYLSDAVSVLENIKQPSKKEVKGAMIWGFGFGNDMDYAIKANGESKSDNMYESELKVTIPHPKSGIDTDVVILKKYSSDFEDVLITEKEVRCLYEKCKTNEENNKLNKAKIDGGCFLLLRSFRGHKIKINGVTKKASKATILKIKKSLFEIATNDDIINHVNELISIKRKSLKIKLNEESSSLTTKEYHNNIKKEIKELHDFKKFLIN